jgi:hypothetical protein
MKLAGSKTTTGKRYLMTNPICLNSNSYHGFTLGEAVIGAKRAGIKLIELAGVIGWTEHVHNNYCKNPEVIG